MTNISFKLIMGAFLIGIMLSACVAFTDYPERSFTLNVSSESRQPFIEKVSKFASIEHFSETHPQNSLGDTTFIKLNRYNMEIVIFNDAGSTNYSEEYQISFYDGLLFKSGEDDVNHMAERFTKQALTIPGVSMVDRTEKLPVE